MQIVESRKIELTVGDIKEAIREYVNARIDRDQYGTVEWVSLTLGHEEERELDSQFGAEVELETKMTDI